MKCDKCDNEATVREVTRVKGVAIEKNLCEQCARDEGIAIQPATHIESLLTHFLTHPPTPAPSALPKASPTANPAANPAIATCASCGLTFAEFKQHGVLGCSDCYRAFETPLTPLLERAHEGMSRHLGKVPKRQLSGGGRISTAPGVPAVGGAEDKTQRLTLIRKQLEEAVKAEQYERAAKLRDEMRRLGELGVLPPTDIPPRKGNARD